MNDIRDLLFVVSCIVASLNIRDLLFVVSCIVASLNSIVIT